MAMPPSTMGKICQSKLVNGRPGQRQIDGILPLQPCPGDLWRTATPRLHHGGGGRLLLWRPAASHLKSAPPTRTTDR